MTPVYNAAFKGNRMSSLEMTQFCGQAGRLSGMGSGRPAMQSTVFHALCARADNRDELCALLTEEEFAEIQGWLRPTPVDLGQGRVLVYEDSDKELAVALDSSGCYVDPESPDAVTVGHLDFAWVVEVDGRRIAYVGDIKRSEYTVAVGTESLQLHAYGLAYAGKHNCHAYAVGIWAAMEGLWQWSEIIDLESAQAFTYARRVVAAAMNVSTDYAMGPHCRKCYGRFRCPAWLIPPELAASKLGMFTENGAADLTDEKAADLLLTVQRAEDTIEQSKKHLKTFAVRNAGIRDGKGKVWRPVMVQGQARVSVARVREVFGADAEKVISAGKPYERFDWVSEKRA